MRRYLYPIEAWLHCLRRVFLPGVMSAAMVLAFATTLFGGMDKTSGDESSEMSPAQIQAELAEVQAFFDAYWLAQASNDASDWGRLFSNGEHGIFTRAEIPSSDDVAMPTISHAELIAERKKLIADYPKRIYQQINDPRVTRLDESSATVRFTFVYHFTGRKVISGKVGITMQLFKYTDADRHCIVMYEEDVKRMPVQIR